MKTLMTLMTLSLALTTGFSAKANESRSEIDSYLMKEVNKELKGQQSCLKGKIAKKNAEMEDNYGGRYHQNIEVQTVLQDSSVYRYVAKYCDEYLDRNMKPTEDASKFVYRHCVSSDSYTYVAVFRFAASTSGTLESEGLALPVNVNITHDLIVKADASYSPEQNEIVKFKTSTKITCE